MLFRRADDRQFVSKNFADLLVEPGKTHAALFLKLGEFLSNSNLQEVSIFAVFPELA